MILLKYHHSFSLIPVSRVMHFRDATILPRLIMYLKYNHELKLKEQVINEGIIFILQMNLEFFILFLDLRRYHVD